VILPARLADAEDFATFFRALRAALARWDNAASGSRRAATWPAAVGLFVSGGRRAAGRPQGRSVISPLPARCGGGL
jgi:hypothetical protein